MRLDSDCLGRTALVSTVSVAAAFIALAIFFVSFADAAPKSVSGFFPTAGATGTTGGAFATPRGVAINVSGAGAADPGDVYVVDGNNQRVQVFSAAGGFKFAFGRDVVRTGGVGDVDSTAAERCTLAADCKSGVPGSAGAMFDGPQGIAIDLTDGSVYVSEQSNRRVQKFTAGGDFLRAWGKDVSVSDLSGAGEVCVTAVDCQAGATADATLARGGEFGAGVGHLAVAPPTAPGPGNVVVAEPGSRRLQEFDSSGGFVRAWGFDVVDGNAETAFEVCTVAGDCKAAAPGGADVGQFAEGQPTRVAIDSTGAVYASEPAGNFRVQKFDPDLTAPAVFAPGVVSGTAAADGPSDVAIGPGDNVLVGKQFAPGTGVPAALVGERRVLELDSTGVLQDVHGAGAGLGRMSAVVDSVDGLAMNPSTGAVYVAATRFQPPDGGLSQSASRVYVLEEIAPPTGSLGVSAVTPHSALMSGSINPNGPSNPLGTVRTSYRIELSEDGTTWVPLAPPTDVGTSATPVGFSARADELKADTAYQVRIILTRPFNYTVTIAGPSFTTPASRPDAEALSVTDRQATSVTLNARINPNGETTSYRFEYGQTRGYGTNVPVPDANAGTASVASIFAQPIDGLRPGTTYYFRVVATNTTGTAVSVGREFTTPLGDSPPERSFEMVSQPDKIGGVGVGLWPGGIGHLASAGMAAYTGERFMVGGSYGAPLNGDSAHGYTNDWSFAERSGDQLGWLSHTPITHPNYQPTVAQFVQVGSVSEDLSRSVMTGGNVTPAIFPEMGADNRWGLFNTSYFLDWGAPPAAPTRWELLGPANFDQLSDTAVGAGNTWSTAFSPEGSTLVGQTALDTSTPPRTSVFGMAGPGDPTWPAFGDLVSGRSVYLADMSVPPANSFAGTRRRELVNVCTGGGSDRTVLPTISTGGILEASACPAAAAGRDSRLISNRGATLSAVAAGDAALGGTVSAHGSRVFFMSPDPQATGVGQLCAGTGGSTSCPPQLYVRQRNPDGSVETRWISKAVRTLFGAQAASLTGGVRFEGATPSGDRVFFRTNSPLTPDDPNGVSSPPPGGVTTGTAAADSWDLYMYEFPGDPDAAIDSGILTRISSGPAESDCNSPLPAGPLNENAAALRFASDDGRRVYFVCSAPLADVPTLAAGSITTPGGSRSTESHTNLYLYDEHKSADQRWTFVARLPRAAGTGLSLDACASTGAGRRSPLLADSGATGANIQFAGSNGAGPNCLGGTADGAFVTFFTSGRLTADDPTSPATGDIYSYDAEADELIRVSAVQGGAGGTYLCAPGKPGAPAATDTAQCFGDSGTDLQSGIASGGGGMINAGLGVVTHPDVIGDRVAFFESSSRLVAEDLDDGYDVYQWRNGELSLVTSGAPDSKHALYKGNDRDGSNVFFVTQDRLTWQDYDAVADVYSARVDGGITPPPPPPLCDVLAGACQGGGAGSLDAPSLATAHSDGGETDAVDRVELTLRAPGARARARAARRGVLAVGVSTTKSGLIKVAATAKIGRRVMAIGATRTRVPAGSQATIKVRLSKRARAVLSRGGLLRVTLKVTQPDARARTATVRLKRGSKS